MSKAIALGLAVAAGALAGACADSTPTEVPLGPSMAVLPKLQICHLRDNGLYKLINVSQNAVPEHFSHGDGLPGDEVDGSVLGADCGLIPTQVVLSSTLFYSSTGWGGWSCPANTLVVSASIVDVAEDPLTGDGLVLALFLWRPGAITASPASPTGVLYPLTPFGYTYTEPEEGAIAQNNGDGGDALIIRLVCTDPS